jgi:hypothetical protein
MFLFPRKAMSQKHISRKARKSAKAVQSFDPNFGLESLEARRLLTSSVLSGGVLTIIAGRTDQTISVWTNATDIRTLVDNGGLVTAYATAQVQSINIAARLGNNRIDINQTNNPISIPITVSGHGSDTIIGGDGHETLGGGQGSDVITADGSYNDLIAGSGSNEISGGSGYDTINCSAGNDTVSNAASTDSIVRGTGAYSNVGLTGGDADVGVVQGTHQTAHPAIFNNTQDGYTPEQIREAYDYGQLDDSTTLTGQGQTVAIVDAFGSPTIEYDLAMYSAEFGLPAPTSSNFEVVTQSGHATSFSSEWALETTLDVEQVRAMAPDAKIILVEANSDNETDLMNTVQKAATLVNQQGGGGVVSMSFGIDETEATPALTAAWSNIFLDNPAITFVASAGDDGAEVNYPAAFANVVAVGGTTLVLDTNGDALEPETAWADSGGGISTTIAAPGYQIGVDVDQGTTGGGFTITTQSNRVVPDVAWDANPLTGVAVFDTTPDDSYAGWQQVGGTSVGAPNWAAIIALANQDRAGYGEGLLGEAAAAQIYYIAQYDLSNSFTDIADGSNGSPATLGYDEVTGWGTPVVQNLLGDLVNAQSPEISTEVGFSATDYLNESDATFGHPWDTYTGTGEIEGTYALQATFSFNPANTNAQDIFSTAGDSITVADLYRASDGTIYGDAVVDARDYVGLAKITGSITTGSNGQQHISGEIYAVDEFGNQIPTSANERATQDGATQASFEAKFSN